MLALLMPALVLGAEAAENKQQLLDEYRRAVEDIELQAGAYDAGLLEPLGSVAAILSERGEHEEAAGIYSRLLHVNRINNGFYDESHLTIVSKMIDNSAADGDWPAVDDANDYLYWLYQRAYETEVEKLTTGIAGVLDWKLAYLGLSEDGDKSKQLVELEILSEELLEELGQLHGDDHPALAPALYQRALIHYLFAIAIDENATTGRRLTARETPEVGPARADQVVFSNIETRPLITSHLNKGKRLLERIAASAEREGDRETAAMATLYLADWDLLLDRTKSASEGYERAYQDLLAAGTSEQRLQRYFARPRPIPVARFEAEEQMEADGQVQDYRAWTRLLPAVAFPESVAPAYVSLESADHVELEFDVVLDGKSYKTRDPRFLGGGGQGNAADAQIVDDQGLAVGLRRKAIRDLGLLTFRPRLENGSPVASQKHRMRYFYALDE